MDGQTDTQIENQTSQTETDPWAQAFAALNNTGQTETEESNKSSEDNQSESIPAGTEGNSESGDTADTISDDTGTLEGNSGGLDNLSGDSGETSEEIDTDSFGVTDEYIQEYRDGLTEDIRDRAINEIAQEFIKRGIRNTNGALGASINDPDICKKDEDGVPHFYNPETGNEFTGDNPRRQAQEWVEDYNNDLRTAFNRACQTYENKLLEAEEPKLAVLEFTPKYEQLDPIRQGMFDSVVEDYEIKNDNGDVVGYTCNLNQVLAMVDRQVEKIQAYAKTQTPPEQPKGPALDMKNSAQVANRSGEKPQFKSLAEAMEWEQDQLLAKMKGNK